MDLNQLAVDNVMCARCEARLGDECVTISGAVAYYTHAVRTKAIYAAWRDGYSDALRDSANQAERLAVANPDAKASAVARALRERLENTR